MLKSYLIQILDLVDYLFIIIQNIAFFRSEPHLLQFKPLTSCPQSKHAYLTFISALFSLWELSFILEWSIFVELKILWTLALALITYNKIPINKVISKPTATNGPKR